MDLFCSPSSRLAFKVERERASVVMTTEPLKGKAKGNIPSFFVNEVAASAESECFQTQFFLTLKPEYSVE